MHRRKAPLRSLWFVLLVVMSCLELGVIVRHRVLAQTPGQTATPSMTETSSIVPSNDEAGSSLFRTTRPPSGNTSEAAQAYYQYTFAQYLHAQKNLRTDIRWNGPFWIFSWAIILMGFFFFYSFFFQRVHRRRGELYGAASFAGAILERIGTVSLFNLVIWTVVALWTLYFIVTHSLWGQIY